MVWCYECLLTPETEDLVCVCYEYFSSTDNTVLNFVFHTITVATSNGSDASLVHNEFWFDKWPFSDKLRPVVMEGQLARPTRYSPVSGTWVNILCHMQLVLLGRALWCRLVNYLTSIKVMSSVGWLGVKVARGWLTTLTPAYDSSPFCWEKMSLSLSDMTHLPCYHSGCNR